MRILGDAALLRLTTAAPAASVVFAPWTTVHKAVTETVTSDSTLTNDAELGITLAASTKYAIRVVLFYNTANATMDFKFGTAYTGTALGTPQTMFRGLISGAATAAGAEVAGQAAGQVSSQAVTGTTSGVGHITLEQVIETNTGGQWSILWAQNTLDAGALSVMFGSYLEYRVIA